MIDEEKWYEEMRQLLETAYLAADNPRAQSGFSGDEDRWQLARRVIANAVNRNGTFLDIGCANGLLMETMVERAKEKGFVIEPYGLDISSKLADLARRRLPKWSDRIYVGNAINWEPPMRFDFVRTELVFVPDHRRRDLIDHLIGDVVASRGRLIVCSYGSSRRPTPPRVEPIDVQLQSWGYRISGLAEATDPANGIVITRVVWIDFELS